MADELRSFRITLAPLASADGFAATLREKRLRAWDIAPFLQGVIMECIETEYADYLHAQPFNPYSQYCIEETGNLVWVVNTLTEATHANLVVPLMRSISSGKLKIDRINMPIIAQSTQETSISQKELVEIIHSGSIASTHRDAGVCAKRNSERNVVSPAGVRAKLNLITPAAFKSAGTYQNLPDLRLMYQNLLMHYSQIFEGRHETDQETIDYLVSHSQILSYDLRSWYFKLAGKKIPAFLGDMTIEVKGAAPLLGLVCMLFTFGQYAGLGIKTSMGMGGMRVENPYVTKENAT